MGGATLSDAKISVTDDGKLVIERKSSSSTDDSKRKTIIRTKEDYENLLEKRRSNTKSMKRLVTIKEWREHRGISNI